MTFTSAMRLTITLYVLGALATVGIVAYAAGASNERAALADRWLNECATENAESHSEDVVSILKSEGWFTKSGDGEFIYSPGCAQ